MTFLITIFCFLVGASIVWNLGAIGKILIIFLIVAFVLPKLKG